MHPCDAPAYARDEGESVELTVMLDAAFLYTTVTVPLTVTANGGATEADYTISTDELVFAPGDTSKTVTVTVVDDTVDDDGESITLSFDEPHIWADGTNDAATIVLEDNDHPHVTVEYGQDSQLLAEGETVQVTVRLSGAPEREVSIPITATGLGGAISADYQVPTSVTFAGDETERTIAFMAVDDEEDDDDESVKLGFGTADLPERITAGTRSETTLKIGDNDNPFVTVMFAQTAYTVDEGGTQQVIVTVSEDPKRTLIIPITATPQGTASAADYSVMPSVTFTGRRGPVPDLHHRGRPGPDRRRQREGDAGVRDHAGPPGQPRDPGRGHRQHQRRRHGGYPVQPAGACGDGGRRLRRRIRRQPGHRALGPGDGDHHRRLRDRPVPGQRYPDLHRRRLDHPPDGDGDRRPRPPTRTTSGSP